MYEQQEFCLNEAITIAIDERLEGFEEFYIFVDRSLSTPPGVRYGEEFLVIIKDDGTTNFYQSILVIACVYLIYSQ